MEMVNKTPKNSDQDESGVAKLPQPVAQTGSNSVVPANNAPKDLQSSASVNQTQANPATAEDSDLIEKEWIEKAKEIVEKNKNDPYALNKELNKVKADYIKKRYNKEVRTSED